jgi:3-oxoacyl-[acyl-carrier protein] reductase
MQRTVLITGGSRGIGKAIAQLYSQKGWNVISPSRSECDLLSEKAVREWLTKAPLKVDALINNAGINKISSIQDSETDDWRETLALNLITPVILSTAASVHMREQKWGRIVNIASVFGVVSRSGRASYSASKHALIGFTRTAALEWGPDNILVNALCPGYVETELTRRNNSEEQIKGLISSVPLRRLAKPEEIAAVAYFLGSEDNSFITGQPIVADGGLTAQ